MLLIKNADLYTMEGEGRLKGGDVLVDAGAIQAVGHNLSAPGAQVIDAAGRAVMPGIVDAHTEGQILSALSGELKGRTAVIIAHRLTAVKNAAEILYMDKGRVLERGTHEQLLAKNGAYAEMWRKQQREEESA